MIKIEVLRNPHEVVLGLNISGHANTAPSGSDIVCAAVSALSQTAVYGIERYLRREIQLDVKHGKLLFSLVDAPDELTSAILETTLLGLKELEKNYPQKIKIFERRR